MDDSTQRQLYLLLSSQEIAVRTREEDEELQRSTKKVKENHKRGLSHDDSPHTFEDGRNSYKDSLVGEVLGAFELAFLSRNEMDVGIESDSEESNLVAGVVIVNLFGETKATLCA